MNQWARTGDSCLLRSSLSGCWTEVDRTSHRGSTCPRFSSQESRGSEECLICQRCFESWRRHLSSKADQVWSILIGTKFPFCQILARFWLSWSSTHISHLGYWLLTCLHLTLVSPFALLQWETRACLVCFLWRQAIFAVRCIEFPFLFTWPRFAPFSDPELQFCSLRGDWICGLEWSLIWFRSQLSIGHIKSLVSRPPSFGLRIRCYQSQC